MQWWNDFVDWTSSDSGGRLISSVLIPFIAIVVAGVVAALIGRGATKRVVTLHEREAKNAAVAGIVSAARKAATWGSLTHDERSYADHLAEDADVRLRLLPVPGAAVAANWAQHEIADIKKHSSTFSFQADQSLADFRDRILEWQARPARARKLFKADLERWKFESPDPDAELIARQQEWNADQAEQQDQGRTPSTTSLRGATAAASSSAGSPNATRTGSPNTTGTGTPNTSSAGSPSTTGAGSAVGDRPGGTADSAAPLRPVLPTPAASAPDEQATRPYGDRGPAVGRPSGTSPTQRYDGAAPTDRYDGAAPTDRYDTAEPTDRYDETAASGPDAGAARAPGAGGAPGTTAGARNTTVQLSGGRGSGSPVRSAGSDVPTDAGPRDGSDRTPSDRGSDRTDRFDAARVDGAGTTATTSVPARSTPVSAEPRDARETDEPTHTQPISASELRRRSDDDED